MDGSYRPFSNCGTPFGRRSRPSGCSIDPVTLIARYQFVPSSLLLHENDAIL
jgi:hypothetical protein